MLASIKPNWMRPASLGELSISAIPGASLREERARAFRGIAGCARADWRDRAPLSRAERTTVSCSVGSNPTINRKQPTSTSAKPLVTIAFSFSPPASDASPHDHHIGVILSDALPWILR